MHYLEALRIVHENFKPRSYVEIGCRFGDSLILAECPAVGIDPNMRLKHEPDPAAVKLFHETSDDFFEKQDLDCLLTPAYELAYIDGMHLAEYALRDFINLEKKATDGSMIMFDDILPRKQEYAEREPVVNAWCGDIYKVLRVLMKYRPDLTIQVFDVAVKGLGIVTGLDRNNTVLSENYAEIEADILAGKYDCPDVTKLRSEFGVIAVKDLAPRIKAMRNAG